VNFPRSVDDLECALDGFLDFTMLGIPAHEFGDFLRCLLMIATSCEERRLGELEHQSWWELLDTGRRSKAFRQFLAIGLTRSLVACRANEISTRTGGTIFLQLLFGMLTPGTQVDRVLNGPTNDVWVDPWMEHLERRYRVEHRTHTLVTRIECTGHRITGVVAFDQRAGLSERLEADWYVAALPVEVMQSLVDAPLAAADPALSQLGALRTSWMNGVQLYLTRDVPLLPGHAVYLDSPWALTSVSQRQFWRQDIDRAYGTGEVHGILSVDVSEWGVPGILYDTPARHCTREQILEEVIAQLQDHLNLPGRPPVLERANIVDWNLDHDIHGLPCQDGRHTIDCINREPLLINTAGSWQYRPEAAGRIHNLFLASDYVRTHTQLACMEGANEAGRRAANGILAASDSLEPPCDVWPLEEPAVLAPLRAMDRLAWAVGAPHVLAGPLAKGVGTGLRLAEGLGGPAVGALLGGLRALRGRAG
jgi:uncharacterized protein with NAD-binding domain and iron-sulfur cluster